MKRIMGMRIASGQAIIALSLAGLALCAFGFLAYRHKASAPAATTQIPSEQIAQAHTPVYAPSRPPQGFTLQKDTISSTNEAFIYSYTYDTNKTLAIAVQPKPQGFDAQKFNPDKEFQTTVGRAYLVDLETRTTAAIVTDDSLIFINAPQKISTATLEDFINSLRRAQ